MSKRLVILLALILVFFFGFFKVAADELADIEKQLAEAHALLDESKKATEPLEANLKLVESKINNAEAQIGVIETEINRKKQEISLGEKDLIKQKQIINERARNYYKQSRGFLGNMLGIVLSKNLPEASRMFFYQQQGLQRDRDTIIKTAFFIRTLEEKKTNLEEEQTRLAVLKKELDQEKAYFASEVAKAKNYQSSLEQKIAELSARQLELIAAKIASIPLPRSAETSLAGCVADVSLDGTSYKDPGFGGAKFAFFSYGVPNKVGLNQYGAKGRAEAGQGYEDILRAYYNFESISDANTEIIIRVDGHSEYKLEDYVKRIYEMPADWDMRALEAQAIAARSYALAYTNNGAGSICDSQQCQVFKDEEKGGRWNEAVDSTRGKIMTVGGQPIKAWYSSTHGGVVLETSRIGWSATPWTKNLIDATSANSFDELKSNAYDRSSPWFYCDWGYRSQYNNTAWLTHDEVLDIVNTFLLYEKDNSTISHLSQTDQDVPDTWSADKVRDELKNRGGTPYSSIDTIYVEWSADGVSKTIVINGAGYNAQTFKNIFNLRAPANIQIKPACRPNDGNLTDDCSYALYNIEKR